MSDQAGYVRLWLQRPINTDPDRIPRIPSGREKPCSCPISPFCRGQASPDWLICAADCRAYQPPPWMAPTRTPAGGDEAL